MKEPDYYSIIFTTSDEPEAREVIIDDKETANADFRALTALSYVTSVTLDAVYLERKNIRMLEKHFKDINQN